MPVIKGDGNVRLCRDYKLTIDSVANNEVYPLPRIKELFAAVNIGLVASIFTTLSLKKGYIHLPAK